MFRQKTYRGFTLVELIVTLAVLAIGLAVAVPSFVNIIQDNRVVTETNSLLGAVNLARSEAVKQGLEVSIQNEAGGFGNGWCVMSGGLDGCENGRTNGLIIREFPALQNVAVNQGAVTGVTFDARGYQSAPGATVRLEMEPPDCTAGEQRTRVVSVTLAGRASVGLEACD